MSARRTNLAILALSLAIIGGAFYFEYVVKLVPCELCLQERWAWYAAILIAALALASRQGMVARLTVRFFALLFVASAGLAFYHVGVEQHVFPGPSACTGEGLPGAGASVEEITKALLATKPVHCDDIQWSLFGISLAGFNLIASLGAVALAVWSWRRSTRGQAA